MPAEHATNTADLEIPFRGFHGQHGIDSHISRSSDVTPVDDVAGYSRAKYLHSLDHFLEIIVVGWPTSFHPLVFAG